MLGYVNYLHTDLGFRKRGEIVRVTLRGNAANVRLMDSSNFSSYKRGRQHRFYGGSVRRSPVNLQIPRSGHWHVCVDLGGLPGRIQAGVDVLPGLLPGMRQQCGAASPLASIVDNAAEYASEAGIDPDERHWDVFISHATEDKEEVVRDLADALREEGLAVWYDEFELKIGDSLRRMIDKGIRDSRFGVVVLSPSFFTKGWPQYERDGLVTKQVGREQVILPLWHGVNRADVAKYSPSLADTVALKTSNLSVGEIAGQIRAVVYPE